ncbi:hypothetical protein QYF36_009226 [Acer negundo]|nr:hypothetical protein QYF36_009226 [Acer negundo]
MICKHLDIQEKIAKEVMEATQLYHNSSIEELASNITEKTLDKMQLSPCSFNRNSQASEEGQSVTYLPYAMGRMKCLWGDDAEEFRPERWLDESGRFQRESPSKFTAFQADEDLLYDLITKLGIQAE